RTGLPGHRRSAGDLGRSRAHGQAGVERPAAGQEDAPDHRRPEPRRRLRRRAPFAAPDRPRHRDRLRPGGGADRGLRRPGSHGRARRRLQRPGPRRPRRAPGHRRRCVGRQRTPGSDRLPARAGPLMAAVLGTSRAAVDVEGAVARARHHLLCRQSPEGWWKGELETNVTMDAEDLFLRHFLGIADDAVTGRAAAWIRSRQREDGTWATFHGGPGDLSTTVEAYAALRLAGDPPDADHMTRAASFVRAGGGVAASRVFTRLWLAAGGLWPWSDVPAVPPEVVLLPPAVPLNIYDFACWARQTIVAISVVAGRRPVWPLPIRLDELEPEPRQAGPAPRPSPWRLWSAAGRWEAFDRALQVWSRHPFGPLRARALEAAERWIVDRQEADGSWGGIQPPWVWSLLALRVLGYPLDHPVLRAGLDGLERFAIEENGRRRLEACQSPVWDTALAVVALTDAGLPGDHDAVRRAADWLLAREVRVSGDWSVRRPGVAPGGWAFEFANVNYPDVDDTAEVLLALDRAVPVHGIAGDAMAAAGARA